MNQINIKIEATELIAAINKLTAALADAHQLTQKGVKEHNTLTPKIEDVIAPTAPAVPTRPSPLPTVPVTPSPTPAPVQVPVSAPAPAAAPQYTLEQLQMAVVPLLDAGKQAEVRQAVESMGYQSMLDIPPERYGELAGILRGMGAKI